MKLTANQTVMLLCIYRGHPEPAYPALGREESETFGGTEAQDLDTLLSRRLVTPGKVGWSLTLEGMTFVEQGLLGKEQGPVVDPAAVAAQEGLRTAKMTHTGYQGEHDEGGAVFKIDGVPLSGPSVYDFGHGGKLTEAGISPQRTYAAFTAELLARWNRGPVTETE